MSYQKSSSSSENNFLKFSVGSQHFAIPLLSVKEVIASPEITPVPQTFPHFLGVTNLRGQIISVIDFRKKLSLAPNVHSENTVIICQLDTLSNVGIMVDSVDAVIHPKVSEVSPPPLVQSDSNNDYMLGVYRNESKLVLLINIEKVLGENDASLIRDQLQSASNELQKAA